MPRLIGKLDDLVFDGGAVPRTNSLNLPAIEGRPGDAVAEKLMRFLRRIGDIARYLLSLYLLGKKGERSWLRVSSLRLEARPINGSPIQPRRGPGLEALPFEAKRT